MADVVAAADARRSPTATTLAVLGGAIAVVGFGATQSPAAIPAGLALTYLAASDLLTRRISLRLLGFASIVVTLAIVAEATVHGTPAQLVREFVTVASLVGVLTVGWRLTSGVAFGDVLLLGFAALVPAWVAPIAVVWMIAGTVTALALVVIWRRLRRTDMIESTLALGPALLAGWLLGVAVG